MKLTNKSIAVGCLERIEVLQEHVRRVNDAVHYIRSLNRRTEIDHVDIINKLYEEEMVEWRKLAMWGLTLDDAGRDRIKAAVHQRFLRDGMSVHDWMSDGVAAGSWLSSDEAEFRAMAKKAFGPKEES